MATKLTSALELRGASLDHVFSRIFRSSDGQMQYETNSQNAATHF
jgi:hypothetical protein